MNTDKLKPISFKKDKYTINVVVRFEPLLLSIIFIGALYKWMGI